MLKVNRGEIKNNEKFVGIANNIENIDKIDVGSIDELRFRSQRNFEGRVVMKFP